MMTLSKSVRQRMERIRDDYYGGKLSMMAAQGMLEALYCEFLPVGCGVLRRHVAAQAAMDHLKPDISGMLEAYE